MLATAVCTGALIAIAGAAPALADTKDSSNWAGYAIHRSGVSFDRISAAWKQPRARCAAGRSTYSAVWVGLGGYSLTSDALEQIGTEVDCSRAGNVRSSAWYELVPQASRGIHMAVNPGDSVSASVSVTGDRVQVVLRDATSHRSFRKTLTAAPIDVSSADWIVEAPSECISASSCETLPLANFGSALFKDASAQTTTGHRGAIANSDWDTTRIRLTPGGQHFVSYQGSGAAVGAATPSGLSAHGSSFRVTYARASALVGPVFSPRRGTVLSAPLLHPSRS